MKLDKEREWGSWEAKLVWLARGALAALAVFALSVQPRYTTRALLVASALGGLVVSALFLAVRTRRPRTLKAAELATLAAFVLHVGGHAFGWYAQWVYYDKGLHLVESAAVALVLFAFSQASPRWIWSWTRVRPFEAALYLACMTVTAGVAWELVEFGMDQAFRTEEQNGNTDTMLDLLADSLGAVLGASAAAWATRVAHEEGPAAVSEPPRRKARPAVHR